MMSLTRLDPALATELDALCARNRRDEAIAHLKLALEAEPNSFANWLALSRLLYEEGRFGEAVKANQAAEQADPLTGAFQTIQRHMQARAFAQAEAAATAMLDSAPGHPRAIYTLAHLATARGDHEGAADILEDALRAGPANLALRRMHVAALEQSGGYASAIKAARACVDLDESFEALWGLITLLLRYGLNQDALEACDRAERLCAGDRGKLSAVALVRGQVLRVLGQREDSLTQLRASLDADPSNTETWWALADMKTVSFSADDIGALKALTQRPGLDAKRRSPALFALARAAEMKDGAPAAFDLYAQANAAQQPSGFDAQRFTQGATRLIQPLTPQALEPRAAPRPDAPKPIFIVGLPRSGSTLVEQILASHSQIDGTMEQPTLPAVKRKAHIECATRFNADYLAAIGRLPCEALSQLGLGYLEGAALFGAGASPLFTDKMPYNFEHIGLIHKILPDAVIVDVRRNPLDCGWSLFKQYFSQGAAFSYRLEDIASYYNGYLAIMDHWDAVLPGAVLHIQYEELVADPAPVTRALLDHAGVAFEPGCLSFHDTSRAVRTASSEQVRQPLYTSGVNAWRTIEDKLEPLKQALGEPTLARFKANL